MLRRVVCQRWGLTPREFDELTDVEIADTYLADPEEAREPEEPLIVKVVKAMKAAGKSEDEIAAKLKKMNANRKKP